MLLRLACLTFALSGYVTHALPLVDSIQKGSKPIRNVRNTVLINNQVEHYGNLLLAGAGQSPNNSIIHIEYSKPNASSTILSGQWAGHPVYSPTCHDNVAVCSLYGPETCRNLFEWAKQQCAEFCVFCINTNPSGSTRETLHRTTTHVPSTTHAKSGGIPWFGKR